MLFIDDLNREILLESIPQRVVCLCPSITETLIEMGVNVVGRTKFCIHPKEKVKNITIIGGTKQVHYDKIEALNPDLIICEKEENTSEMVQVLEKKYPVYVVNVESWKDGIKMIKNLGYLLNKTHITDEWLKNIPERLTPIVQQKKAVYLIWYNPIMTVGKTTYINDILNQLGFMNPFENHSGRYPIITLEEIQNEEPDYLFLSSEPFPFKQTHIQEFQETLKNTKIMLVDGEMFSWYGIRMQKALYFFINSCI